MIKKAVSRIIPLTAFFIVILLRKDVRIHFL